MVYRLDQIVANRKLDGTGMGKNAIKWHYSATSRDLARGLH